MNNERNKRIHALVFGNQCGNCGHPESHHEPKCYGLGKITRDYCPCEGYVFIDYFSETLPDNLRVAMVTAAVEKFGALGLCAEIFKTAFDVVPQANNIPTTMLLLPAPAIAEAIDKLLLADDETGRWKMMQTI